MKGKMSHAQAWEQVVAMANDASRNGQAAVFTALFQALDCFGPTPLVLVKEGYPCGYMKRFED